MAPPQTGKLEAMQLNMLLREQALDPAEVVVLRHRPYEPALNRVFPWLVSERRDLFDTFQKTHGPRVESALKRARHLISCIRYGPGKALFVGHYHIGGATPLTLEEYWADPAHQELRAYGQIGFTAKEGREAILSFDLRPSEFYRHWQGRLILGWPGLERSWYRWADRNDFPILAIAEDDQLAGAMPLWDELVLAWDELSVLPKSWRSKLAEWRGIYLIHDLSDGRGYVGSAYGEENLLGRWLHYAVTKHGDNRLLLGRDASNFRFSVLQRVSPDMPAEDVIRVEAAWKKRLHTHDPSGLNAN